MIPGPTSSQVGMGLGYRFAGWQGAAAAWLGFTLPSAVLMFCVGLWILNGGGTNGGAWFITAMKLVAVGIVTQAVLGMWKQLCVDRETKIIALIAAVAFYSTPTALMQVSLIAIALVAGYVLASNSGTKMTQPIVIHRNQLLASIGVGVVWALGIIAALSVTDDNVWAELIAGHYISGALVFGGGHVVLPLLESEFVPPMESSIFLAGYGFAQAMPTSFRHSVVFRRCHDDRISLRSSYGWRVCDFCSWRDAVINRVEVRKPVNPLEKSVEVRERCSRWLIICDPHQSSLH